MAPSTVQQNRSRRPTEAPELALLGRIDLSPVSADPTRNKDGLVAEISTTVTIANKLFTVTTGGSDRLTVSTATDPRNGAVLDQLLLENFTAQSVASFGNLVAVALSPNTYDDDPQSGLVRFFQLNGAGKLKFVADVPAGFLPDSLAFNGDGTKLVVANEGQPSANFKEDPAGSLTVITITGKNGNLGFSADTVDFVNDLGSGVTLAGLRIGGKSDITSSAEQAIEPEYVAILGNFAYVSLQENNAVAKVDLTSNTVVKIFELGAANYATQFVDLDDRDGPDDEELFNPVFGQPVLGLRMPDGLDAFEAGGKAYFVTANEGDSRDYEDKGDFIDENRVEDVTVPANLADALPERLKVIVDGNDPVTAELRDGLPQSFGSRSISVFDADTGALVWDSGMALQNIAWAADVYDDGRSDDKGVEPESVIAAEVGGTTYLIAAMERSEATLLAVFAFDADDPAATRFVTYEVIEGSLAPEGLKVVPAAQSPTGRALLIVTNEATSNTIDFLDLEVLVTTPPEVWPYGGAGQFDGAMLEDVAGGDELAVSSLLTVGEYATGLDGKGPYVATGILDGLGAYDNGDGTYTVLANSELNADRGAAYEVNGVSLTGARVHRFIVDLDIDDDPSNGTQSALIAGGIAYTGIYDANGAEVTSAAQINGGFNRFCSSTFVEADSFEAGTGRGFVNDIYLTGEEADEGLMWALDTVSGAMWALPGLGRAGWENAALIDTGSTDTVAVLLMDDNTAPLYLWVGTKDASGGFLERNGLAADNGNLYTWVPSGGSIGTGKGLIEADYTDDGISNPVQVPDSADLLELDLGTPAAGSWELVGSGTDVAGWSEAELRSAANGLGALQLSRLEDVHVNPGNGRQAVFATTGNSDFGAADLFGNLITLDFASAFDGDGLIAAGNSTALTVIVDGDRAVAAWETTNGPIDTDAERAAFGATILRSPDNLTWSADGYIYVQEDRSVSRAYFAQEEASIWKVTPTPVDPVTGATLERWARIDRSAVPVDYGQSDPRAAGGPNSDPGNWESSGIIDVSAFYGADPGTYFLASVQAHSLVDGNIAGNAGLVQGGQLDLLQVMPAI
jgi:hypothetical protein